MTTATLAPIGATADQVLACVSAARDTQDRVAADLLALAADWADLHPALDPDWAAGLMPGSTAEDSPLAGDGTPTVDERCLAELGAALGRSTDSARMLVADALELRHRLPRLWRSTLDCRVPVYVARDVALSTRELTREAVAFVDRQLANLPTVTSRRVARLVEATIARFLPDLAEQQRVERAEYRHVDIDASGRTDGLAHLSGILDLADAIDLDTALAHRATELGQLGVTGSLNVRRSIALGDLARASQDTLDLIDASEVKPPARSPRQVPGRQIVLYVHLSDAALTGNQVGWLSHATGAAVDLVDLPVLSGQVRDWIGQPSTRITVKPVIDLNEPILVPGYQVPDRIKERLQLRDRHCVFPWCHRRATDADHIKPHREGGPTSTENLAPLCRRHHRSKTFTAWRYRMLRPGVYLWTSPHGRYYLRDTIGTYHLESSTLLGDPAGSWS